MSAGVLWVCHLSNESQQHFDLQTQHLAVITSRLLNKFRLHTICHASHTGAVFLGFSLLLSDSLS
jgi:hypothetical protein